MNNYASIVKYFRIKRNLTLNSCADNICTKNYLHMIEKGIRTPSYEILEKLCFKLKIDLEDFTHVLESSYPIESYYFLKRVCEFVLDLRFDQLFNYVDSLTNEEWINEYPIKQEILLIKSHEAILRKKNTDIALILLKTFFNIDKLTPEVISKSFSFEPVNFKGLNLTIFYYIYMGDLESALKLINFVREHIEDVKHLKKYNMIYIGYSLLCIEFFDKKQNNKEVLVRANELKRFQVLNNNLKWLDQSFFYSSKASFLLKEKNQAIDNINKAIEIASILGRDQLVERYEKFKLSLLNDIVPNLVILPD